MEIASYMNGMVILCFNVFCAHICYENRLKRKQLFPCVYLIVYAAFFPLHGLVNAVPLFESLQISAFLAIMPLFFLCHGSVFGKIYYAFFQLCCTHLLTIIASGLAAWIGGYGSQTYVVLWMLFTALLILPLAVLVWKIGYKFVGTIMEYLHMPPWVCFSFVSYFIHVVLSQRFFDFESMPLPKPFLVNFDNILLLISLIGGLFALTTAMITTQLRQKESAELAAFRTGREYYDRLKVLSDELRVLSHDYKFQLNAIRRLTESGHGGEALAYIDQLDHSIEKAEMERYSNSAIINALIDNIKQRCETGGIDFFIQFEASIGRFFEYEMSVVIGNLLENSYSAASITPEGKRRYIELVVRCHEEEIGIMTQNSFDITQARGLKSNKPGGGIGMISIKRIAKQNGGRVYYSYDDIGFRVYVTFKRSLMAG